MLRSCTWRVGGLSEWVASKLLSTLTGILIGVMILTTLYTIYLLSPPTLQVIILLETSKGLIEGFEATIAPLYPPRPSTLSDPL